MPKDGPLQTFTLRPCFWPLLLPERLKCGENIRWYPRICLNMSRVVCVEKRITIEPNVVAIKVDWQARICRNMSKVVCGAQLWANTTLLRSIGRGDRWPHWGKSIENLNLEANQVVPGSHQIQLQGSNCEHSRYKRRRKTQIWEVRSLDCKLWTIKICRTNL